MAIIKNLMAVGGIDLKRIYPRECYKSWFHYLLKIPSPSKIAEWSHKRNAIYLKDKGIEVWVLDKKTNGEKLNKQS